MSVLLKIDIYTNEKIDNSCVAHAQRSRFNIRLRYSHKTEQPTSSKKNRKKRNVSLFYVPIKNCLKKYNSKF